MSPDIGHRVDRIVALMVGAFLLTVSPVGVRNVRAQSIHPDAGTYALTLLNGGMGPVGSALAEGLTAWPGVGADAVYWNPAAAAGLGPRLELTGSRLFGEAEQTALAWATRVGRAGLSVQLHYSGLNGIEVREGPTPEPLALTSAYDLVGTVSGALRLAEGLDAGLGVKLLYEKLDLADAFGVALDAGVQVVLPRLSWLRAGLAVRNIGRMGAFETERPRLPWTSAFGLALTEPYRLGTWSLRAGFDLWRPADDWTQLRLGVEAAHQALRLRLGHRLGEGWNTLSAGAGFVHRSWRLDYAYTFDPDADRRALGAIQRLGLTLDLGGGPGS
jgi:hypothetical protein